MPENSKIIHDMQYYVPNSTKFVLMALLLLLNIVIRIPSIPHEKGYDSFFIHSLANSISNFGSAEWWINWMSVFGLYPYSYASAVPFTLSGLSQLTGIEMEYVILLFCVFLGLFSIFSSYLLATIFCDSFIQRFLFSILFSLSAGTINLTTWEITTRAQFLVLFPFIMYLFFKMMKLQIKYVKLFIIMIILLFATHHYVYFALFYSMLILFVYIGYTYGQKIKLTRVNINYLYLLIVLFFISVPFLFPAKFGLITAGSRYTWIQNMVVISVRNLGFVFPLAIGGFAYISLKMSKRFEEWAILICLVPTLIFSYNLTYGYITTYLFLTLIGTIAILNVMKNYKQKTKLVLGVIVIFLILNTSFSTFFVHYRLGTGGGYFEWYMRDETYATGEWIKDNIAWDKNAMSNGFETGRMVASYGGLPPLFLDDITNYIYGFIIFDENNTVKKSIFSKSFYFDNPVVLKGGSTSSGLNNWVSQFPVTDVRPQNFINAHNISYFFGDRYTYNRLFQSLPQSKNGIYDSGRMQIWIN